MALIYPIAWGSAVIIEGFLLRRRSMEYDTSSELARFFCAYAPSLLLSLFLFLTAPGEGIVTAFSRFYLWTSAGIAAADLLIYVWIRLCAFLGDRHSG